MIIILIIGAVIAITFNIWNKKNPVNNKNQKINQQSATTTTEWDESIRANKQQRDMTKDFWDRYDNSKRDEGTLYDSNGNRIK